MSAALIQEALADGVIIGLSPAGRLALSGERAAVERWTPAVQEHRADLLAALEVGAVTSHGWLLHFADREPLETYHHPDATHAEILDRYPDALAAEPIPERIAPGYEIAWPDAIEPIPPANDDTDLLADIAELDGLIQTLCDLERAPAEQRQAMLSARRTMRPVDLPESLAELRRLVAKATKDKRQ